MVPDHFPTLDARGVGCRIARPWGRGLQVLVEQGASGGSTRTCLRLTMTSCGLFGLCSDVQAPMLLQRAGTIVTTVPGAAPGGSSRVCGRWSRSQGGMASIATLCGMPASTARGSGYPAPCMRTWRWVITTSRWP